MALSQLRVTPRCYSPFICLLDWRASMTKSSFARCSINTKIITTTTRFRYCSVLPTSMHQAKPHINIASHNLAVDYLYRVAQGSRGRSIFGCSHNRDPILSFYFLVQARDLPRCYAFWQPTTASRSRFEQNLVSFGLDLFRCQIDAGNVAGF